MIDLSQCIVDLLCRDIKSFGYLKISVFKSESADMSCTLITTYELCAFHTAVRLGPWAFSSALCENSRTVTTSHRDYSKLWLCYGFGTNYIQSLACQALPPHSPLPSTGWTCGLVVHKVGLPVGQIQGKSILNLVVPCGPGDPAVSLEGSSAEGWTSAPSWWHCSSQKATQSQCSCLPRNGQSASRQWNTVPHKHGCKSAICIGWGKRGIEVLSEIIRHRKSNTVCSHLYLGAKEHLKETESRAVVSRT